MTEKTHLGWKSVGCEIIMLRPAGPWNRCPEELRSENEEAVVTI